MTDKTDKTNNAPQERGLVEYMQQFIEASKRPCKIAENGTTGTMDFRAQFPVHAFKIGEQVGTEVVIEVVAFELDSRAVFVRIVKAGGWTRMGFYDGLVLALLPQAYPGNWNVQSLRFGDRIVHMPWFSLNLHQDGRKTFEHYR